jgi:DNA-binding XRE family transcriptional regulator
MNALQKELKENFQKNLRMVRQACHWDQQELAEKIGVSRQTMSGLENGRSPLSGPQYLAIAVTIDFYNSNRPKLIELIGAILSMSNYELGSKAIVNGSLVLGWLSTVESKKKK